MGVVKVGQTSPYLAPLHLVSSVRSEVLSVTKTGRPFFCSIPSLSVEWVGSGGGGSRLTVALGEVEEGRVVAAATELLRLVHQRLLHGLVPTEDHHPSGPQVHCVHCAEFLAQLRARRQRSQGALGPETPLPSSKPSPLTLVREVSISWERSCSRFPRNGRALGPGGSRPLPFELVVRSRQTRARIRSKMAVLMLSMVQAVAGTWVGSWVGRRQRRGGSESLALLISLWTLPPPDPRNRSRWREKRKWRGRHCEKVRGWGKRWKERGREGERGKRA